MSNLLKDWVRYVQEGLLILSAALLSACLPADPGVDGVSGLEHVSRQDGKAQKTRSAPTAIDPRILASRAFGEAPDLANRVARGELPPVSERLPEHPLVIAPLHETGVYGGTLRRALTGDIAQTSGVSKTLSENLMGYTRPFPTGLHLNLAESYAFEEEGRSAVFRLREGVRWSDGVPFTVDDILFWYYDIQLNEDARDSALPPSVWIVEGKPIEMEKVDDHTLRLRSHRPMGRLLHAFSTDLSMLPKHYFSRFHPRYDSGATYEVFRDSSTVAQQRLQPGVPRLSAWVPVEWVRGQRVVYERNPYYWKVDTSGNQLPYIDRIVFNIIQDQQVILLKFMNGEIDVFGRYSRVEMYPTLKAEEAKGKFRIGLSGPGGGPTFYLNWDADRASLREAFRNRDVRIAMSHAVNRDEIGQIVFHGLLEPSGYSFTPGNRYFSEESYRRFAAYDPGLSNELLDEAGYPRVGDSPWRQLKDGSTFEVTVDISGTGNSDVCEIVKSHWEAVGIKTNLNISLRDIIWPRRVNGEFDIHMWGFEGPQDPLNRLNDWAIMGETVPFWHRNASREGPQWLVEATRAVKQVLTTVDTIKQRDLMERVRDLHTENVAAIVVGSQYNVWGASRRLGNVPEHMLLDDVFRGMRAFFHEQIFLRPDVEGGS